MKHRVLAGPFSALERRFLETIAELQRTDPLAPVPVLVGSNILAAYLRKRIADDSAGAANVRFYTFLDLVNRLAGAAGSRARLTDLAAARILEDLLAQRTPAAFRQVAGLAGFRAALLATFRDLRDAGVSPQVLDESVRALLRVCSGNTGGRRLPSMTWATTSVSRSMERGMPRGSCSRAGCWFTASTT